MLVMPVTGDEDCNKQFPLTLLLAPVQLNLVCSFAGLHDKLPSLLSRNALVAGQTNRKYYNYTTRTIWKLTGHDMQCCKLLLRSQCNVVNYCCVTSAQWVLTTYMVHKNHTQISVHASSATFSKHRITCASQLVGNLNSQLSSVFN